MVYRFLAALSCAISLSCNSRAICSSVFLRNNGGRVGTGAAADEEEDGGVAMGTLGRIGDAFSNDGGPLLSSLSLLFRVDDAVPLLRDAAGGDDLAGEAIDTVRDAEGRTGDDGGGAAATASSLTIDDDEDDDTSGTFGCASLRCFASAVGFTIPK